MSLGLTRRKMRIKSLQIAAEMINTYIEGGISPEELGLTDEEFEIFHEENKKVAVRLVEMAEKLLP